MNKLKNVTIIKEGDEYQAIGNFRLCGEAQCQGDDSIYTTTVLVAKPSYSEVRMEAHAKARDANVGLFDLTDMTGSVPLYESYAQMKGE